MRDASLTLGIAMWWLGSLSAGCSSDPPLDCAWLASDNCWKMTASAAITCLPDSTTSGTFSADNKTCTYASGAVVTFATPVTLPPPTSPTWDFTLTNGGQTCLRYVETDSSIMLTVSGKTFSEGPMGSMGLAVSCPDGQRFSTSNAFNLLACGGNLFGGGLPGNTTFTSSTSVSFGLLGTSTASDQSLTVFDCHTP
jgi:hypothetical protein